MLLQETLRLLDAELERILRIREIVAGLGKGTVLPEAELNQEIASLAQAEPERTEELQPAPSKPARRSHVRRPFTPRKVTPRPMEPRALTNAIPAGPVVMSAQALARERETRAVVHLPAAHPSADEAMAMQVAEGAALDSLTNDLARRWLSRSASSSA